MDQDNSSIDNSGGDGSEIPVAVPVAETSAAAAEAGCADDAELSDGEADDAASKDGILDTTGDTAEADDEEASHATDTTPPPSSKKRSLSEVEGSEGDPAAAEPDAKKPKSEAKQRQPGAKGLVIPFRTIKRIMKLDDGLGIVQNDAAVVATAALELFVKRLAQNSLELAKKKGRNTIKYDDVAEARAGDRAMSFLDLLLP